MSMGPKKTLLKFKGNSSQLPQKPPQNLEVEEKEKE